MTLRADIAGLRADVLAMRADIGSVRQEQASQATTLDVHHAAIRRRLTQLEERIMVDNAAQAEALRSGLTQLGTDLDELAGRIEAKIEALGSADVDLSAELDQLRGFSAQVDAIGTDPTPEEPPTEQPEPPTPEA